MYILFHLFSIQSLAIQTLDGRLIHLLKVSFRNIQCTIRYVYRQIMFGLMIENHQDCVEH
jgi:hypothetical protein